MRGTVGGTTRERAHAHWGRHVIREQVEHPPARPRAPRARPLRSARFHAAGQASSTALSRARRRSWAARRSSRVTRACSGIRAERAANAPPPSGPPRATTAARPARATATSGRHAGSTCIAISRTRAIAARACRSVRYRTSRRRRVRSSSWCEPALDVAVQHQRNLAGFLGDHHGDGVVLLRQANRCAVTRPELAAQARVDVSGRKHAAAAIRSSCTMTAPSCSGDSVLKIVTSRS